MAVPVRITEENYAQLQLIADMERRSITAQLNLILEMHFQGVPKKIETSKPFVPTIVSSALAEKNKIGATPEVSDLFKPSELPDPNDILNGNREQECCLNELAPCKHWVWDATSGDGYKNTLSGRLMEVE